MSLSAPGACPPVLQPAVVNGSIVLPDYQGGGLFNLAVSVARLCGADTPGDYADLSLPNVGNASNAWARHDSVVLFLVDGLGDEFLSRHRDMAPNLWRDRATRLTSVFPSTTATAITTLMTARPASQHGLLGWFVRESHSGRLVAPLPMRYRNDGPVDDPEIVRRILSEPPTFGRARRQGHIVTLPYLAGGPYSAHHTGAASVHPYADLAALPQVVASVKAACAAPHFIYCYTPLLDAMGHDHGTHSPEALAALAQVDAAYAALRQALPDSLIVLTADHGFVDSPPERNVDLGTHSALHSMLAAPLSGEGRCAYCHVRPGMVAAFGEAAEAALGRIMHVVPSAQLFDAGLFGPGEEQPARERAGDWALIGRDDWTVYDRLPGERRHPMLGVHGGLSPAEMYVPLVLSA
ncbi:alkaline phosphatase family protein [Uliginosibacterium sp. sgz301328]|uniref:alkaline phosphatase family protein n=1 Tax=Uliginosibacterium sp. sgz301328 TaxID=3243764 RepID=UPI00359DE288